VNHIIFMMQENRSFDSYFGKINDYRASLGLGRDADDLETDFANPADSPDNQLVKTFHLGTSCIYNTSAAWLESHGNANRFDTSDSAPLLLDGFVHTAGNLAIFDGDPDTNHDETHDTDDRGKFREADRNRQKLLDGDAHEIH